MDSFSRQHLSPVTKPLYAKHKIAHLSKIHPGFLANALLGTRSRI
jgi:hypothetical protein